MGEIAEKNMIDEKESLIHKLNELNKKYLDANIEYKTAQNNVWLNTDFSEATGSGRPTVDEKKAVVSSKTILLKEKKDKIYDEICHVKLLIELCDDKISLL